MHVFQSDKENAFFILHKEQLKLKENGAAEAGVTLILLETLDNEQKLSESLQPDPGRK